MKVIGAGLPRTGTLSQKVALEMLGFRHDCRARRGEECGREEGRGEEAGHGGVHGGGERRGRL